jgi:TolA-binding protein
MHPDERDELLERMGRLAHDAFSDATKPVASAAGKRQLKVALSTMQPRRNVGRWAALATAALLAIAALFVYREMPRRLAYEVEGSSPSDGGYLQGTTQSPAIAHFTDGTEIRVNAGARARIVDVENHGARVALEQGRAHLRVVHLPETRWSVDAGPFSIAVTGTEFDAEWSAAEGVLVVEMRSGAVIVRGPLATDGVGVHGGQRLVASVPDGRLHIEPLDARAAAANAPKATVLPDVDPTHPRSREGAVPSDAQLGGAQNDDRERAEEARPLRGQRAQRDSEDRGERGRSTIATTERDDTRELSHASRGTSHERREHAGKPSAPPQEPSEHDDATMSEQREQPKKAEAAPTSPPAEPAQPAVASWAKRVASGDFRGVVSDAESRGLATTLAEAPLGDLVALADAARYTGSSSIARDALTSQRKRYPSSADAKNAAFLLGRIAEDGGATGEAIEWYERYLSEAPRGAFAAEALGREMLATGRTRGAAAGAVVARRYLDRFPGGPYAERARKLLAAP